MGFRVKVNFEGIEKLASSLDAMPNTIQRAALAAGQETVALVEETFADQKAPGGAAWAPKVRPDGRPILVRGGRLSRSFRLIPLRRGFIVRTGVQYASFHMTGTRRMVSRPFFPRRGRVPGEWRQRWVRVVTRELLRGIRS